MQIVYGIYGGNPAQPGVKVRVQGGHKMILRHVETLRDLGFDAVAYTSASNGIPSWFQHRAPIVVDGAIRPNTHVIAVPDDALQTIGWLATTAYRTQVLVQNHFNFADRSIEFVERFPADRLPGFIAVSPSAQRLVERVFPAAKVELVRAFADERVFKPATKQPGTVVVVPRKRPQEARVIRKLLPKLRPEHARLRWRWVGEVTEADVAQAFAASPLFLSLSRLEGLGMTPIEAMASGCVVAGFTGIGGRDFATDENGFWVADEDCEAAVEALACAADLVKTGGASLKRRLDAGFETARQWSYAAFRAELEAVWMRLAPEARIKNGPLD